VKPFRGCLAPQRLGPRELSIRTPPDAVIKNLDEMTDAATK
jgi:hypothetical protein